MTMPNKHLGEGLLGLSTQIFLAHHKRSELIRLTYKIDLQDEMIIKRRSICSNIFFLQTAEWEGSIFSARDG